MIPATALRVATHTPDVVTHEIQRRTEENLERCARGGHEAIDERLRELDHEWDVERALQTNFAILAATSVATGAILENRWFYRLAALASLFMVQHAVQGWCPPLPIFRRLGFRTAQEIDRERFALKALRGDFASAGGEIDQVMRAVEA